MKRAGYPWRKICLALGVGAVLVTVYLVFGDALSLSELAEKESAWRQYQADHPWIIYGAAFGVYVSVTALSLPGAAGMTLVLGWLFGFWRAVFLVSFASTLGATLAFLLSRYLLRDAWQARFGERLQKFNRALAEEGAFYLFTLRLIPVVPFFVINVVMGWTPIRTRTFWWVSQLGMLPGTMVYVYAGSAVPSLEKLSELGVGGILTPQVLVAFVLLGLFPITMKKVLAKWRKSEK